MNKNILKYIPMLMALFMVSCSSDDTLEGVNPSAEITSGIANDNHEATAIMGGYEDCHASQNKPITRSSFVYDRIDNLMKFTWNADDKVGVFYKDNDDEQITFKLDNYTSPSSYSLITLADGSLDYAMQANKGYISYIPYRDQDGKNGNFTYRNVPVTFLGQQQKANVTMNSYRHLTSDKNLTQEQKDDYSQEYYGSEAEACAHLGDYNYQVSDVLSTPAAHVHFNYHAVSTVVRFFMNVKVALYYDSLQIVNNDVNFMQEGTMNVLDGTFNASKKSHMLSLKFIPSIDMTNNKDLRYWHDTNGSGYLMAYLMIAPIDLTPETVRNTTLYLCGHEENGTKHYYKAELSKINFVGGKHYQWSPKLNPDEPITFEEVTVQKWYSAVYNNEGKGTESW